MTSRTEVPAEFQSQPLAASEKQLAFLRSLADERDIPDEARAEILRRVEAEDISKSRASEFITRLLDKPKKATQRDHSLGEAVRETFADMPEVPAGRYAVENAEGEFRFYRVDRPESGRWAGYVFVKVQHGPDESRVRGSKATASILSKIERAGVRDAALRYGHEIGSCSNCGRRLTNRVSRELAIGPICGGRMFGDEFADEVRSAREAITARGEDPDEEVA